MECPRRSEQLAIRSANSFWIAAARSLSPPGGDGARAAGGEEQLSSAAMAAEEGIEDWRVARLRLMLALLVHWMHGWQGEDCVVAGRRLVQCSVLLAA